MATKDFDFKALGEKKLVEYKKEDCKPMMVKKAKAALIMIDFRLKGKKTPCVLIPFKKPADAQKAFKKLKKDKVHILKKTGLCKISVGVGEDGKDEITVEIKQGGLSPEVLEQKGTDLFGGYLRMTLNVLGAVVEAVGSDSEEHSDQDEDNAVKENIAKQEAKGDEKSTPKMTPERKAKINENMDKINARLETMVKKLGL